MNHDYNTLPRGARDKHEQYNENFQVLDTEVEIRDAESAMDQYDPKRGAKYTATDSGSIFVGDGSDWIHFGDVRKLAGNIYVRPIEPIDRGRGDLWIDTDRSALNFFDGDEWVTVGNHTNDTEAGVWDDSGASRNGTWIIEDGESDMTAYEGEVGYYGITPDAIAGSGSVLGSGAEWTSDRTVASTSGLESYPRPGDTLRWEVEIRSGNSTGGVLFGVQSESSPWSGYRFLLTAEHSPGVVLRKDDEEPLSSVDASIRRDTTYGVELHWGGDGLMPFVVREAETGKVIAEDPSPRRDTSYRDGGVGFVTSSTFRGQSTAEVAFDNLRSV